MNTNVLISPKPAIYALILFFGLFVPISYWLGWRSPLAFGFQYTPWPAHWAQITAACTIGLLIIIPSFWMVKKRLIDPIGINAYFNALLLVGYFLIDVTSAVFPDLTFSIRQSSAIVVLINSVGFFTLFICIGLTYSYFASQGAQLPLPIVSSHKLDQRLQPVLRVFAAICLITLILPMIVVGEIPLFSATPNYSRVFILTNDFARPLYNFGTGIAPALVSGLIILSLRGSPYKSFTNFTLASSLIIALLGSYNRFPIALSAIFLLSILTTEFKIHRVLLSCLLITSVAVFLVAFGFASVLRQGTHGPSSGGAVNLLTVAEKALLGESPFPTDIETSFKEAFLGDNLIDVRDASWVFSQWDYVPLNGKSWIAALTEFLPSGIFPEKKEWKVGLIALRIIGKDPTQHPGLRTSFFGQAFLNFGPAGVIEIAVFLGVYLGIVLYCFHITGKAVVPCLTHNLYFVCLMQIGITFFSSTDTFPSWSLMGTLFVGWLYVKLPFLLQKKGSA